MDQQRLSKGKRDTIRKAMCTKGRREGFRADSDRLRLYQPNLPVARAAIRALLSFSWLSERCSEQPVLFALLQALSLFSRLSRSLSSLHLNTDMYLVGEQILQTKYKNNNREQKASEYMYEAPRVCILFFFYLSLSLAISLSLSSLPYAQLFYISRQLPRCTFVASSKLKGGVDSIFAASSHQCH